MCRNGCETGLQAKFELPPIGAPWFNVAAFTRLHFYLFLLFYEVCLTEPFSYYSSVNWSITSGILQYYQWTEQVSVVKGDGALELCVE